MSAKAQRWRYCWGDVPRTSRPEKQKQKPGYPGDPGVWRQQCQESRSSALLFEDPGHGFASEIPGFTHFHGHMRHRLSTSKALFGGLQTEHNVTKPDGTTILLGQPGKDAEDGHLGSHGGVEWYKRCFSTFLHEVSCVQHLWRNQWVTEAGLLSITSFVVGDKWGERAKTVSCAAVMRNARKLCKSQLLLGVKWVRSQIVAGPLMSVFIAQRN